VNAMRACSYDEKCISHMDRLKHSSEFPAKVWFITAAVTADALLA